MIIGRPEPDVPDQFAAAKASKDVLDPPSPLA
jgi:hypothetical protein